MPKKIKERKVLNQLYDLLKQRKMYLNDNFKKYQKGKIKGSFTEIEVLESFVKPLVEPILRCKQKDCPVQIGDKFFLKYDKTKKEYTVTSFPYSLTVSGVSTNYELGAPLTITCYYKDCIKINKKNKKKKKNKKHDRKNKKRKI